MQKYHIELVGAPGVQMLTHNERLANPLDPIARQMKEISSKRTKTPDDLAAMARLEFVGGLYLTDDGKVGIPAWNVFRCIQEGGKLNRLGKSIERAVQMIGSDILPVEHDGPSSPDAMWDAGCYDSRSVKIGTSKVTRCRPRFTNWRIETDIILVTEVLSEADLRMAMDNAGLMCGLGDYRPRFGRFDVAAMDAA